MTAKPFLDRYPDLQKSIELGLANADRYSDVARRSKALRAVLDEIRARVKPSAQSRVTTETTPPEKVAADTSRPEFKLPPGPARPTPIVKTPPPPATLWERLGGEVTVRHVVDDWVAIAASDPKVDFTRGGKIKLTDAQVTDLKNKLVVLVSQVTDGPLKYGGRSMKEAHKGMGITNAEFDAAIADFKKALDKNEVKPAEAQDVVRLIEGTRNDIVEVASRPSIKTDGKKGDKPKGR
jgi:hemoglobin